MAFQKLYHIHFEFVEGNHSAFELFLVYMNNVSVDSDQLFSIGRSIHIEKKI